MAVTHEHASRQVCKDLHGNVGLQSNLDFQSNQIKSESFQFCKSCFISKCFGFTLEIDVSICMTFTFFCASIHTHVIIDSKATLGHESKYSWDHTKCMILQVEPWNRERTAGPQFTGFPKFIKKQWQEKMPTDAWWRLEVILFDPQGQRGTKGSNLERHSQLSPFLCAKSFQFLLQLPSRVFNYSCFFLASCATLVPLWRPSKEH